MKLVDLPQAVLDDLCQEDRWRLDIDPGFDSKHEFWMAWRHFLVLPEPIASLPPATEEHLAALLTVQGFDVLLPVPRSHHLFIHCLRLIPSADTKTLTLFLHDAYHQAWFRDARAARYGFLAVADRYEKGNCHFYLASYYHFVYLLQEDYAVAGAWERRRLSCSGSGQDGRAPRAYGSCQNSPVDALVLVRLLQLLLGAIDAYE